MPTDDATRLAHGSGTGGLRSASFLGLVVTQFLTAVNDNVFRWLVIGVGKDLTSNTAFLLMAGTVAFVLPYIVFASLAGYLADRLSKRTTIVGCKVAEILIVSLGVIAIWTGSLPFLLAVVAMTGIQSALFSPSKLGCIPEILRPEKISAANGLFGMTTVGAIAIGTAVGGWLKDATGVRGQEHLWISAVVLIGVAVVGTLASLMIRRLPAANPDRPFPWNAATQTVRDLRTLAASRAMLRVALGNVFFWSLGALAQLNIDQFTAEGGGLVESQRTPLLLALVFGVGLGSLLAGVWSAGHVELGIVPLGAFGVALFSILLSTVHESLFLPSGVITIGFGWACFLLFSLGASAGLFDVPLEAYLQHRSPPQHRGAVLAAANFMVFSGMALSSLVYYGLRMPIMAGSVDRIAADLRGPPLTAASQQHVTELAGQFAQAWEHTAAVTAGTEVRPRLEDYLAQAPAAEQSEALARLLWVELEQRQRLGDSYRDDQYGDRFGREHAALVARVLAQSHGAPLFTARQIFLLFGMATIPVFLYIVCLIPQSAIRFAVWLASKTLYRIRVFGHDNLPERGGALLVPNHVSWIDGVLLLLTSSRPVRIIVWAGNFHNPLMRFLGRMWGVIPIDAGPRSIRRAIATARQALLNGELVAIFAEGGISRSGQLQTFRPGLMKIIDSMNVPVIPVYLDELWGSIFSYSGGRLLWKWPRHWPYPVSIHFGRPIAHVDDVQTIRRAVEELGAMSVRQRSPRLERVGSAMIRACKRRKWRSKVTDSTGGDATGGTLLMRSLILRRLLRRRFLAADEKHVGVLLPASLGGVVANAALTIDNRVAVNLNFTVSSAILDRCLQIAGIRHVLTSHRFVEKIRERMPLDLPVDAIYLEDLVAEVTMWDKLVAAVASYVVPGRILSRWLGVSRVPPDDVVTIIFTSGSTGEPKGVMLTQTNITTNVEAVEQVVHLTSQDVLIGVLPFFHSFGYTITLWCVLMLDVKGAYHYSPLEPRQIGKLSREQRGTVLLGTPTFLRGFLKRCNKEDFASVDVVVAGAEKLPRDLVDSFEARFGMRPVEGYGTTELSPLVSVNVPPTRSRQEYGRDFKEGTVGRPVPGVCARVTDLESGQELPTGQQGMLWIKGPNVMKGYLGRPDLTAEVIRDGWYMTGDLAMIDDEGFITITGRESRFSKIGGEMVPHLAVEEALAALLNEPDDDRLRAVVTAVRDPRKGERLVVLHTATSKTPEQIRQELAQTLPNLFVPSEDSFLLVDEIPLLGSGKLDLKTANRIARERLEA